MPHVSVVINNCNYGRYLVECLESVLNQVSGYPIEIIVVDDGSTDDSLARLHSYRDRVCVITQANAGQGAATNKGVSVAQGEWIFLLDADDLWYPEKIRTCMEAVRDAPNVAAIQHGYRIIDAHGRIAKRGKGADLSSGYLSAKSVLEMAVNMAPTSCLGFRRDCITHVFPIPADIFRIRADLYLHAMLATEGPILAIPAPLTLYRIHGSNRYSGRVDGERLRAEYQLIASFVEWLAERGITEVRPNRSFYFARAAIWKAKEQRRFGDAAAVAWEYLRHNIGKRAGDLPMRVRLGRALVIGALLIHPSLGMRLFNYLTSRVARG